MGKIKRIFFLLISMCLIMGMLPVATYANETAGNKVNEVVKLGSVKLRENVTADIKNLLVMPAGASQIVGFTLTINNNSGTEVNFLDYWINLQTKSGTKLNVQTVNKNVAKVPAKSSLDIQFYSNASNQVKVNDLSIQIIQWDFSVTSYTRVLGTINVPARYNPTTPRESARSIAAEDIQASFFIKQAIVGRSESYYRPEIRLVIRNDGKRSITLPDYQIFVMTADHLMYPVTVSNIKGTVLNPLMEKEFQLTVSIPRNVSEAGWKLAVMYPMEEGKVNFPLGLFELPKGTTEIGEDKGKFYTFQTTQGIYNIKLDSLNRLPIEEDDLIVANLTIANKSNQTLPIPEISGKYLFNESIEKEATATNNDKLVSIQPEGAINVQVVGRIPYTFDISKLKLVLQQKEAGTGTEPVVTDLVEFTYSGTFDSVSRVAWDTGFKVEDTGYRSEVKARNKMLFSGSTADIVAVQLTVKNNEKRTTNIQKFAGYFEKADGTVYPATIDNVSDKIGPGGVAYVYAWASVPKETDISDMNLVIGKAVVNKSSSEQTEDIVGYAEPYSIILPEEFEAQKKIQQILLPPYNLSIINADTKMDYAGNTVKLKISYELTQDLSIKADTKNDKIIIELKDPEYKSNFTKELTFPQGPDNNDNGSSSLLLGENTAEFSWTDEKFVLQIQKLKNYELNVYLQKQPGYKKLIATETIPWFIDRKLGED